MKITQDGSDVFEAKEQPFFKIAVGIILLLAGLLLALNAIPSYKSPLEVALVLIAFGAIVTFLNKFVTITARKDTQKVRITSRSLLTNDIKEVTFSQVKRILVKQGLTSNNKSGTNIVYNTYLDVDSNNLVLLSSESKSFFSAPPQLDFGKRLAAFIRVPFEEMGVPSLGQLTEIIGSAVKKSVEETRSP